MVGPPSKESPAHAYENGESPFIIPRHMFLDLPRAVIRSVARFRLCAHTLQVDTVTWTHNSYPSCDLCNANH